MAPDANETVSATVVSPIVNLCAILSAFLVILGGMSLVYRTDPTFGTPGTT